MLHLLKYRFILVMRNRVLLFWTLIFPMVLTTFFGLVLRNAYTVSTFDTIEIAIVETKKDPTLHTLMPKVKQGKKAMFQVHYVKETEAKRLLAKEKIAAYVKSGATMEIVVNQNGLDQTITQKFFDEYMQKHSLLQEAIQQGSGQQVIAKLLEDTTSYVHQQGKSNTDISAVFFYSALAMNALFGGYWSINSMYELQANQSERAARLSVSPMHKGKAMLVDFIVDIGIQTIFLFLLFMYMYSILKISFGTQLLPVLVLLIIGSFAGNAFGILIGTMFHKLERDSKVGIMTAITLIGSALSGMMLVQLKFLVQHYVPFLTYINPVNMITDGLYALYYYGLGERYYMNLGLLIGFSVLCYLISFRSIRCKSYDSLGVR